MEIIITLAFGLAGSLLIAGMAYRKGSLSKSGAIAAVVLGTTMFAVGSVAWFGTLIIFFLSSSLLSKMNRGKKQEAEQHYEKIGGRDAGQVLANGGVPLIAALAYAFSPQVFWWHLFPGSLAAVNADTWATELGALSRSRPRSILSGKRVLPGTSGGVTLAGFGASLAGGGMIGLSAFVLSSFGGMDTSFVERTAGGLLQITAVCAIAGLLGSLADSSLGASLQANYQCQVCGRQVEVPRHCNRLAQHIRGWRMLRNDQVNVTAAMIGGLATAILYI